MIEINRGVYMDEHSGDRLSSFEAVRRRILDAVDAIIEAGRRL